MGSMRESFLLSMMACYNSWWLRLPAWLRSSRGIEFPHLRTVHVAGWVAARVEASASLSIHVDHGETAREEIWGK